MAEDSPPPDETAAIANAVRVALAEHGYERLTTAKIAAEYGKSEAGLYYHFDSKDEMIAAFLEHTAGTLADELAAVPATDPETRLRAACEGLFLGPGDEDLGVHIAVMELLSHAPHNETLREPLRTLSEATLSTLEEIIRDGVEDGGFRADVDPAATATFLLAAADGSTGFHGALEMNVGDDLERGVDAFIDSVLAGEFD